MCLQNRTMALFRDVSGVRESRWGRWSLPQPLAVTARKRIVNVHAFLLAVANSSIVLAEISQFGNTFCPKRRERSPCETDGVRVGSE
jgi:hypothetical protein